MSNVRTLLAATFLLAFSGAIHAGETLAPDVEALLHSVRANKRAPVSVNLPLTDEDAEKFWPVYERYQKELAGVQDRLAKMIEDYTAHFAKLSDEDGARLVRDYLAIEADRVKIRQAYVGPLSEAIPGRKVARFYQIENKMDAVLRYGLARLIPVIEE